MIAIVAICLCFAVTIGQAKIAFPKNCSTEAISIAAEFIENHSRHVLTLPCFQSFATCLGFDVMTPIKICADELGLPQLNDPEKMLKLLGDTENNYFTALQAVCCAKTKDAELNHISYDQIHDLIEKCIDKSCGN